MRNLAFIPVALALLILPAFAGDANGAGVQYVGGTIDGLSEGSDGKIQTSDGQYFAFQAKKLNLHVEYGKINLLEYGQNANRRIAMAVLVSPIFLLSKSRQHFLTVGYSDDEGKQQAMVFKVSKGKLRSLLASLEARTGRKVEYQDGEARKAGKG